MVHQVRVRGRLSMQRLLFPSPSSTFLELQLQVFDLFHVEPKDQILSLTPIAKPTPISAKPNSTLSELKINNGDILYLGGESDTAEEKQIQSHSHSESSLSSRKLTPRCTHGPNGGCPHCMGAPVGTTSLPPPKCNHGPNTTCIHCSSHVAAGTSEPAAWLCNHPETVFCPKCVPPSDASGFTETSKCCCDHSKGQQCLKCVSQGPVIKVDKIPYSRYLLQKKALCKFKHPESTTCPYCLPDPFPSFKGKPNCDKGHAPWPQGVCLSCAPPNANLRLQSYRHTDSISIEARVIQTYYTNAKRKQNVPRAAILIGKYQDEPEETKNPGAIRALVCAVYEPPQEYSEKTGVVFTRDDRESAVHVIAAKMGMEPVGWIVTSMPREGEKYGGKVLLSGTEVRQAARLQARYANLDGYSRFVTVLIEHQKDQVEPKAYQVADMAVGLEAANAFVSAEDPNMLATRTPNKGEMVATIVYKDRPLLPGTEFLPDELLVKVNIFSPKTAISPFLRFEAPSNAGDTYLNSYLTKYKTAVWEDKLSDFNLLVSLHRIVKADVALEIGDAIATKKPIRGQTIQALTQKLQELKII